MATKARSALDGLKLVPLDSLQPDPRNSRKHNDRNLAAIRESLARFGQVMPVVVRKGVVVGGHGTLTAMRALGWTECRIVELDKLSESDAKMLRIALNRTAELAEWDYEALSGDFRELLDSGDFGLEDLANWGWEKFELEPLLQAQWSPDEEDGMGELGGERDQDDEGDGERLSSPAELQARIEELERLVAQLRAENARLESALEIQGLQLENARLRSEVESARGMGA